MLNDLKIKMLQTNNMTSVLLSRLSASQKIDKLNLKIFDNQKWYFVMYKPKEIIIPFSIFCPRDSQE